jgi:hypothetical protein
MLNIDNETLYQLIIGGQRNSKEINGFIVIDREITSHDMDDGGAYYDLVIKEIATNKFYSTSYCDWDVDNTDYDYRNHKLVPNGNFDLNCEFDEVEPVEQTIIVYKKK